MKRLSGFVGTTIVVGVFYLVQVIVLLAVIGKALGIAHKL